MKNKWIFLKRSFFKINVRSIITILVAFLLLVLWHRHLTFMDEADNILGALAVVDGKDIYSGFLSQHTPFVYYYFSLFALIGVRDYETFRLCMSFTILVIWLIIFFRYNRHFGSPVFLVIFLLYPLTASLHWGHMILSDVFQGFALFVLLLELIIFWRNKQINMGNAIFISASIFISIMSAFISIYPVFVIFIGFSIHELMHNKSVQDYKNRIKSYFTIVWVTAIPFSIILLWYFNTGNLKNFYFQAYEFNRTYYSKYIGGFGSDSLSVFKNTLVAWVHHITTSLTHLTNDTLIATLLVIFVILFLANIFKENKVLAIIIFVFIAFAGIRGYTNWHATTYYIVSFFGVGYVIDKYLIRDNVDNFKKVSIQILTLLLFLISFNNYIPDAGEYLLSPKGTMSASPLDVYIQKLTKQTDTIWTSDLVPNVYIKNHRKPASRVYALVPWFADAFSNEVVEDLSKNKPKLVTFVPEGEVWGHKYKDFAASIFTFIQQNYKVLNPNDPTEKNIYILNDYYNEASSILWVDINQYGLKNGMLVTDESKVFLIENNTKRYITNPEVFDKNGFKWNDVKKIGDGILSKIKSGKQIDLGG